MPLGQKPRKKLDDYIGVATKILWCELSEESRALIKTHVMNNFITSMGANAKEIKDYFEELEDPCT